MIKMEKESRVWRRHKGYNPLLIHRRDPTTAQRGNFCLLCFHPGPVRSSLINLDMPCSHGTPILTQSLVWTPDLHRQVNCRTPKIPPSNVLRLPVAGITGTRHRPQRSRDILKHFINSTVHYNIKIYCLCSIHLHYKLQ